METIGSSLPRKFTQNISRTFGESGRVFLEQLPLVVEILVSRWTLRNMWIPENLSYNFVAFAQSDQYGMVVVKIAADQEEFETEVQYALEHNNPATRRVLDVDFSAHAMLLEHIEPGYNLDEIADKTEQAAIAIDVISNNPQLMTDRNHSYPSYKDWMDRSMYLTQKMKRITGSIEKFQQQAVMLYDELHAKYRDTYLLHGDLHHENILFSKYAGWKVIDPKGVVDLRYLEIGRYIRNDLWRIDPEYGDTAENRLGELSRSFAAALESTMETVYTAVYIDAVLSNSWSLEGSMSDSELEKEIAEAEMEIGFFSDFL